MYSNQHNFIGAQLDFSDTAFDKLMQKRIYRVLLVCSHYDAFMLEEDGRIDEQIFNEYVSLNLRYPPTFVQAHSAREALEIIKEEKIDLIISMLNVGDIDTFDLAKQLKKRMPQVPLVVLTHFSREVSVRLEKEDLSGIDYVFSWLGNADLLLAIIKLIEDKMNAPHDILEVGVQCIILVEDSVRYYSTVLPALYKIVVQQARSFMQEALNEHRRVMRMRGRPKILLATNYDEAVELYEKYKNNVLGIISDTSFKEKNRRNHQQLMGVKFCEMIRSEDPNLPIILQSSDLSNKMHAEKLGVGFVGKYSKTFAIELRDYIAQNFGFGDFVFIDPASGRELVRACDLAELQQKLKEVPDDSLEYHTKRNHISKWLNARALFSIAQLFKPISLNDFSNLADARNFIVRAIASYRESKGKGIIAAFDRERFDEYAYFSRIGEGSIGGKARGLAFINNLIRQTQLPAKYPNVSISIPRSVVISTQFFDEFMEANNLYKIGNSDREDDEILQYFMKGVLSPQLMDDLWAVISVMQSPIAVRSSSKLEDSHYQPFAGIYSTYMVPRVPNDEEVHRMLCTAIKCVYASVFFRASKAYMTATSNVIDEEKMGILLQEVCGTQQGNLFYPTLSGVARSINFYPIGSEKPEDGIATIGYGLGKLIVDGGVSLRFSPRFPKKVLQLSQPELALKQTQRHFYALNTNPDRFSPSVDDGINIEKIEIANAESNADFFYIASTFDYHSHSLKDGIHEGGKKLVTFSSILRHNSFPLAEIVRDFLELGQTEMNVPVEIEFAANLNIPKGKPAIFNLLQIRPIVESERDEGIDWGRVASNETLVFSNSALGQGSIDGIKDIVYVIPSKFNPASTQQIALEVEDINRRYLCAQRNYVLVGPGRWGSSDPWLGIPIKWSQISEARVIVESGLHDFRVDPSQGTHFFQNLTAFRVGYFTVNPYMNDGVFDVEFLNNQPAFFETEHIRCVCFNENLEVQIDGKASKGVVFKPGMGAKYRLHGENDCFG